jgi:hypothetical protein
MVDLNVECIIHTVLDILAKDIFGFFLVWSHGALENDHIEASPPPNITEVMQVNPPSAVKLRGFTAAPGILLPPSPKHGEYDSRVNTVAMETIHLDDSSPPNYPIVNNWMTPEKGDLSDNTTP